MFFDNTFRDQGSILKGIRSLCFPEKMIPQDTILIMICGCGESRTICAEWINESNSRERDLYEIYFHDSLCTPERLSAWHKATYQNSISVFSHSMLSLKESSHTIAAYTIDQSLMEQFQTSMSDLIAQGPIPRGLQDSQINAVLNELNQTPIIFNNDSTSACTIM